MIKKSFITEMDKKYIKNYCRVQMDNGDLVRIKSLACLLEEKYALYEIMQYIKRDLNITKDKIWHGEANYIITLPRGHIQLINDLYFNNCYLHQYIVVKELDLDMEQIQKYIVHHIDQDKGNNNITNLWIFYDTGSHIAYHQAIKHNKDTNIKEFTENYIESIINSKNAEEIKHYLAIVDKLQKRKNAYLLASESTLRI